MGWGEPHRPPNAGAGTTGEIELAHEALDAVCVPRRGSLAERVLVLVARLSVNAENAGALNTGVSNKTRS